MKLQTSGLNPVQYHWVSPEGEALLLNDLLGKKLRLQYKGLILCVACGRKTSKSFQQGYCFPCTRRLAACDLCILRPHTCHYHLGTCREPEWGLKHCMIEHIVYLANTSHVKVGLTRSHLRYHRWADQGATEALPIISTQSRYHAGLAEHALMAYLSDKTNWRTLLQGNNASVDLKAIIEDIKPKIGELEGVNWLTGEDVVTLSYPILTFPKKVNSLSFDKEPCIEGVLMGIKGQYLLFEGDRVLNIRKFSGYQLEWSIQ